MRLAYFDDKVRVLVNLNTYKHVFLSEKHAADCEIIEKQSINTDGRTIQEAIDETCEYERKIVFESAGNSPVVERECVFIFRGVG